MDATIFDVDLLVIGAGSGGLAAAERAAIHGAKVAIAESATIGGACVNYGCIPEKLLDSAASFNQLTRIATSYGWSDCERQFDWAQFITAKDQHIRRLNELHRKHLQDAGVQLIQGQASFLDAHTVLVGDRPIHADKILVAVGAEPEIPRIAGIEHSITWRELYHLPRQPQHIAILGNDPIGVKIAGSLNELGSQVVQIFASEQILPELDAEMGAVIQNRMDKRGVQFCHQTNVEKIEPVADRLQLHLAGHYTTPVTVDTVLLDARRRPNLTNLNLNRIGVQLTASGAIRVDRYSRTTHLNIFAIGDCTDRIPLTPSAIAQARSFADTEFGKHPRSAHLDWVPMAIAAYPEAATVGLSESAAYERFHDAVYCYRTQFRPLLYSLPQLQEASLLKVIVNRQDSERILGIHMVGMGAVEIIQSLAVALKLGATKRDLDEAIGIHPSSAEELFSM